MPDTTRLTAALGDRYAIEREIGSGGMATVYLARDLKHDRDVALKVLRADLSALLGAERFLREIRITAGLDHPHILTLIDSGETDGILYYVLPLVRGESLRARLERERQLPVPEAVAITRQVADALEYAHRQGVVHRDVKPENILLHEGVAVVADFGIALALREAGGARLTETGLSLGTPQYMSPEQATGDRALDARSDVYSLAAVLYEMLAGEPPLTGPTVQAVVAKLLTEKPRPLRAVRETVPEPIAAAVARALAKVPADRFPGAAAFAAALAAGGPRARRRPARLAGAVSALALVLLGGAWAIRAALVSGHERAAVLGPRRQLTFSGSILQPALSPDGKQLAYFTRACAQATCTFTLQVQDVGSSTAHPVLGGISAAYGAVWSPDRRNLIVRATIGGRWGSYLVSALGGAARYLTSGGAAFWAGGDSLLVGPQVRPDSVFYVRVQSLDGRVADSLRVPEPGRGLTGVLAVPGSRWVVVMVMGTGHTITRLVDRDGRIGDSLSAPACFSCPSAASRDALWVTRGRPDADSRFVVRIGLDPKSGRLATHPDTVLSGTFTRFSVTADGTALAYDDGAFEYSTWAVGLADALHGRLPDSRRVLVGSNEQFADVSPDGSRLLVSRFLPSSTGRTQQTLSIEPFDGGRETPLDVAGSPEAASWVDSVTVAVATESPRGMQASLLDVRTGAVVRSHLFPDSNVVDAQPLPDGWAWIPSTADRIVVERGGQRREIPMPPWFGVVLQLAVDRPAQRIAVWGWNAGTFDSLGVAVMSLGGGAPALWTTRFAETGDMRFLDDGSLLLAVATTEESITAYRLTGPGRATLVGTIPRPVIRGSVSADGRRITLTSRDFRGDVWMSPVTRR